MTDIDTNVDNYTLSELLTIVEIENESFSEDEIMKKTNKLINKFKNNNPQLSVFFKEVQSQLLQYWQSLEVPVDDTEGKIVVESFGNMSNEAVFPAGINKFQIGTKMNILHKMTKIRLIKLHNEPIKLKFLEISTPQ